MDISSSDTEASVMSKLGTPSSESISSDGMKKISNYDDLNISLIFTRARVDMICMDNDGIRYSQEYSLDEQGAPESAD